MTNAKKLRTCTVSSINIRYNLMNKTLILSLVAAAIACNFSLAVNDKNKDEKKDTITTNSSSSSSFSNHQQNAQLTHGEIAIYLDKTTFGQRYRVYSKSNNGNIPFLQVGRKMQDLLNQASTSVSSSKFSQNNQIQPSSSVQRTQSPLPSTAYFETLADNNKTILKQKLPEIGTDMSLSYNASKWRELKGFVAPVEDILRNDLISDAIFLVSFKSKKIPGLFVSFAVKGGNNGQFCYRYYIIVQAENITVLTENGEKIYFKKDDNGSTGNSSMYIEKSKKLKK